MCEPFRIQKNDVIVELHFVLKTGILTTYLKVIITPNFPEYTGKSIDASLT